MMGVNFAFGDYENFHAAINAGIIPSDCFIVLRSNGDAEFLFLDRDNNLVSIVDRNRFESIDEAMSYASDSRLSGKTISVFDGVQWRLYIIQADGSMDPVVLSGDEEPSISLDKTLTISGMAADAKAVGDTIEIINGREEALGGRIDELKARYDEHTHSWNDLTDKPFYEDVGEQLAVCCDAVIPAEDLIPYGDPVYSYHIPEDKQPEGYFYVGDYTYEVIIDGVAYRLQASKDYYTRLGDSNYETYPFCFFSRNGHILMSFNAPGPHTVKIIAYQGACTVVQLDEKFIPDTIARTKTVTALAGRLDILEAIDHDAYVAADTALKAELQAAIDVAKTELKEYVAIQPDWSQSDESAADFIKNKTHYSAPIHAPLIWNGDTTDLIMCGASMSYLVTDEYIDPENYVGATIVFSDGREHIITEENMNISTTGSSAAKGFFTVVIPEMNTFGDVIVSSRERVMDPAGIYLYNDGNFYIARINFPEQLKQLDEKYIPDAIARTADVYEAIETLKTDISAQDADVLFEAKDYTDKKIASIEIPDGATQIQADWNQTDATKADFIKNKPQEVTDEEIIAWLNEEDIVAPAASASGALYTTNENEIYIL